MGDQAPMLRSGASVTTRLTVLVTIGAWLFLSNHCVLGAVMSTAQSASEITGSCPMHPLPAKKKPAEKNPCCKDVRAIVAKWMAANPVELRLISSRDYDAEIFARPARMAIEIHRLDTGPPGCFSFAETVLQESMLSHAPPLS